MWTPWLLVLCLGAICFQNVTAFLRRNSMTELYQWKYIDYKYNSNEEKQSAIRSGEFNHTKCFPIDVDRWQDKTFVTVIRDVGVPSSLNIISNETGEGGPLLQPYPDWSWTNTSNCDGIISVFRVAIDRCNRLWVLDTGIIGENRVCPAKLLMFDLPSSKLLKRIIIPDNIARNSTTGQGVLVTPIVQTFGIDCAITNVYIADVDGYALIVYNGATFRRLTSSTFVYDPRFTNYTIERESFTLEDGILGMALSPLSQKLYFSPMSSHNLARINTNLLTRSDNTSVQVQLYNDILETQSSAKAMSRTGVLFFGLVNNTAIGCWNEFTPLRRENLDLVAVNSETLQFTSGMKVKLRGFIEELLILTNRYQKIARGTLNFSEINFRILSGSVTNLIQNTKCLPFRI